MRWLTSCHNLSALWFWRDVLCNAGKCRCDCLSGATKDCWTETIRLYVQRVGHAYGRRTMHGHLRSHRIQVSQARLAASLRRVAPIHYQARRHDTYLMLNPAPYCTTHYGEKLHLDQNEKLVMYGITHVLAVDGYSRKIIGLPLPYTISYWDLCFSKRDSGSKSVWIMVLSLHLSCVVAAGSSLVPI